MNPFQLLAVGQSLIKGRNTPSPYKVNEEHLLPKFASVGRPISLAPPPKPVAVPKDLFRSARAESAGVVPAPVTARPVAAVPEMAKTAVTPAPALAATNRVPVFSVKLAEPKPRRARKFFGFGAKKAAEGNLVQAELSLDGVKVMRNDLSDSDFEIIAPKPKPVPTPAPEPEVAARTEETAAVSLWKRWSSRLVGAMRTII